MPTPTIQIIDLFILETGLVLVAIMVALFLPTLGAGVFRHLERMFGALARRPILSLIVIAIAPLALRALLMPIWPPPAMHVHDEYSYLLEGDTFAHGRLTNSPHPLWQFFESIHILQQPTYMGMYQPGQGLFLALGQVLTGTPWFGVAISTGLMCAALLWMLRGSFSPGWALFGASIAVIRIGIFSYWMSAYWGGSVAAMGGALAAGALIRLLKSPQTQRKALLAACFGLGIVVLANTRPYEGGLFAIPLVGALLWKGKPWRWQIAAPLLVVLAAGAAFDLYFDWRVTGDPFQLPQMLQRQQYAIYGYGAFDQPRPEPKYRHAVIRDFYVTAEATFHSTPHNFWELIKDFVYREKVLFYFFLGPLLLVPIVLGARALLDRKLAILGIAFLLVSAGFAWLPWPINSHYAAPITCVIYAYLLQAMRRVRYMSWNKRPVGAALIRSVACICILMAAIRSTAEPLGMEVAHWPSTWFNSSPQNRSRAEMLARLLDDPGKTLVIVRYTPLHNPDNEWVYNAADIDHAKVVWAREMASGNQKLLEYFKDRRILLLEPDFDPDHLVPYTLSETDPRR